MAPDLRGHGDSEWAKGSSYGLSDNVYDLTRLMRFAELQNAAIVSHSMGGMVALAYAGTYPDRVSRLVVLDGAFLSGSQSAPIDEQMSRWIDQLDRISEYEPSAFKTIEEAAQRLSARNKRLTSAQALHLARHGIRQNADGLYRWKFDHYQRARAPYRLSPDDYIALWSRITCPTLLMWGERKLPSRPRGRGPAHPFQGGRTEKIAGAGHWLHHDRLDVILASLRRFLGAPPPEKANPPPVFLSDESVYVNAQTLAVDSGITGL